MIMILCWHKSGKKWHPDIARPLTTNIETYSSYDVIFIGYPIWVETAAPPIRTFLTTHDLAENRRSVLHERDQLCRGKLPACPFPLPAINCIGGHTDSSGNV